MASRLPSNRRDEGTPFVECVYSPLLSICPMATGICRAAEDAHPRNAPLESKEPVMPNCLRQHWPSFSCLPVLGLLCLSSWVQADDPIVPPDAKLEKLFESHVLTEGVSVARDGSAYFSETTFSHKSRDDKEAMQPA